MNGPATARLTHPHGGLEADYWEFLAELRDDDPAGWGYLLAKAGDDFGDYLDRLAREEAGLWSRPGLVPQTTYWLVDGERIVGECRLRHRLNESLLIEGGHIGYLIRPSCRRRGYGTRILALALVEARQRGLERVLVTCNSDNVASARIIVKNGGWFEDEQTSPHTGRTVSRYWITLTTT